MHKKAIYCKHCQQKIGTGVFDSILNQRKISKGRELPQEIEMPDLNDEHLDRIEVEKTERFGPIIQYPCKHCGEFNFLNVDGRITILFNFYLSLLCLREHI